MSVFTNNDRLRWVSDGQKVTADVGKGRGLRCVVVIAAGHHALVRAEDQNGKYKDFERWYDVTDLFPEMPKPIPREL